jgi:hypothetical protein
MTTHKSARIPATITVLALLALPVSACNMDVINPGVVDATSFDPSQDASTLSLSAQSNFYKAYGTLIYYSAFLSGEAYVGAVRQETNDIGRRVESSGTGRRRQRLESASEITGNKRAGHPGTVGSTSRIVGHQLGAR